MYEPKQSEIEDKVQELLAGYMLKTDWVCAALCSCLDEFRAFYHDNDAGFDYKEAIEKHIINSANLVETATNELIAERGTIVRIGVDNYKFVPHDTRY